MSEFVEVVATGAGWTTVRDAQGNEYTLTGARNWRNNNPGNIEWGPFARSMGAIGTDGRFAVFPTYEQGREAKAALLFDSAAYRAAQNAGYGAGTIGSAIHRYAPANENPTERYIETVARAAGVSPNTRLADLTLEQRAAMLNEMERFEGFRAGDVTNAQGVRIAPADIPALRAGSQSTASAPLRQAPTPATMSDALRAQREPSATAQMFAPTPATMSDTLRAQREGGSIQAPAPAPLSQRPAENSSPLALMFSEIQPRASAAPSASPAPPMPALDDPLLQRNAVSPYLDDTGRGWGAAFAGTVPVLPDGRAILPSQEVAPLPPLAPPSNVADDLGSMPAYSDLARLFGGGASAPQADPLGQMPLFDAVTRAFGPTPAPAEPRADLSGVQRITNGIAGTVALPRDVRPQVPELPPLPPIGSDDLGSMPSYSSFADMFGLDDRLPSSSNGLPALYGAVSSGRSAPTPATMSSALAAQRQASPAPTAPASGPVDPLGQSPSWGQLQEFASPTPSSTAQMFAPTPATMSSALAAQRQTAPAAAGVSSTAQMFAPTPATMSNALAAQRQATPASTAATPAKPAAQASTATRTERESDASAGTITGSATGANYNVGQVYQSGDYLYEARADGTFAKIGRA